MKSILWMITFLCLATGCANVANTNCSLHTDETPHVAHKTIDGGKLLKSSFM